MKSDKKQLRFDSDRCMGCCACEIACKMEYELPRGVRFLIMRQEEEATASTQKLKFHLDYCRQCSDPSCMAACPEKAIYQRDDGIILVKEEACTGCGVCLSACPYHAPQLREIEDGRTVMQKCSVCVSRLDRGLLPSCVVACPAGAIEV